MWVLRDLILSLVAVLFIVSIIESPVSASSLYHLHPYHFQKLTHDNPKFKVEHQGSVLKKHVTLLRETFNKQVELIFLIDSSASVGSRNFFEEVRFVRKLLADFAVDQNKTRVAVITFSSRAKVFRQVDYLTHPSQDNHKCSLLGHDLPKIRYTGGGTYTLGAFREAKKVLRASRKDATKALFLMTDGFSNGGDPRPEAQDLKAKGVKIFTFGIRNGNVKELHDMASNPKNETCYILDSFEEFEALARRALHQDLHIGNYKRQKGSQCSKLCPTGTDCCHPKAHCTCGTHSGKYECICKPGYYGDGLEGGCHRCPSGTYKDVSSAGGDGTCITCPDRHHITRLGATSLKECICKAGFHTFGSNSCAVLQCANISAPAHGYFVQKKCANVFNAACGVRCKPGYGLAGSSLRVCQENGSWTGSPATCTVKTCPPLQSPKHGNMICNKDDFSYRTECRFTCDVGYRLLGSRRRKCLTIAMWTGIDTSCREITCRPLPEVRDGRVLPEVCTKKKVPFGTTCHMSCHVGYTLIGPHTKQCTPSGFWTPDTSESVSECNDTTAPLMMCPQRMNAEADPDSDSAIIEWKLPVAIDNSGFIPKISAKPAVVSPAGFSIGRTVVTYMAEDLNKNQAACTFSVIVTDKQPPRVDRCVSPLPIILGDDAINVKWEEPIFSDNSEDRIMIEQTHKLGASFPKGKTKIYYTAYDMANNNVTCVIDIVVQDHKCQMPLAPVNGKQKCKSKRKGIRCSISCKKGYAFAIPTAESYFCDNHNGVWYPKDNYPFPDCSARTISNDVIQPATVMYMGDVSCKEKQLLNELQENFKDSIKKRVKNLCTTNAICEVHEVEITCEEKYGANLPAMMVRRRQKRAVLQSKKLRKYQKPTTVQKSIKHHSIITFDFMIEGSMHATGDDFEDEKLQSSLLKNVHHILLALQEEAEAGMLNFEMGDHSVNYENMIGMASTPRLMCMEGSVLRNNVCVLCPAGTFFNVVHHLCESCLLGMYQHLPGQLACMVCPQNMSTPGNNSKDISQCRAQCLPGTFSRDGIEQCETCFYGQYQSIYGQTECIFCPNNSTTSKRGMRRISDCKDKCGPGYVSKTGLFPCMPCPRGTYQGDDGQLACYRCPHDADTAWTGATRISHCQGDWDLLGDSGYMADGGQQRQSLSEIPANPCFSNPCMNGSTCQHTSASNFECHCARGYGGMYCGDDINECALQPCLNKGTCLDQLANYKCICQPGFTGRKCERDLDECSSSPCLNGGRCTDQRNGFICTCTNGYTGVYCDVDINECLSAPCMNGKCENLPGTYKCRCPKGFHGVRCEIDKDECTSIPCLNGGTCFDEPNKYRCECAKGFTGPRCETNIDDCMSMPCQNGATCIDQTNGYECLCSSMYGGTNCESEMTADFLMDFPSASITKYSAVTLKQDLTQMSIAFWMKTDDTQNYGTPISYANGPTNDNAFTITDYTGFAIYVNGENVVTDVEGNDGIWHHITISWSSNRGAWKIYKDGLLLDSGFDLAAGGIIKGGGTFVLGQEQDSVGGSFSANEAYVGQISQLNIWDEELSYSQIDNLLTSCDQVTGNVISWPQFIAGMKGRMQATPAEFCGDCPEPNSPEYGTVEYDSLSAGSVAYYKCLRGFDVVGRERRKCLVTGTWEDEDTKCERKQCGYPGRITNGYVEGRRFAFDNRVRYRCYDEYQLIGPKTRYCNEYGFWEGNEPKCIEIACELPDLSTNTKIQNPKEKYTPGYEAIFFCLPGHKLYTSYNTVLCQGDGTWDKSVPTCDHQRCRNPPKVNNSIIKNWQAEYSVGSRVKYECKFGHIMSQDVPNYKGEVTCLPSGNWDESLPQCDIITCAEPMPVANAIIVGDKRIFLSQVRYNCEPGFELTGSSLLECVEDGSWSPKVPSCNPISCEKPDDVENAEMKITSYHYNSLVTFTCNAGYTLSGNKTRKCLSNAEWSGSEPSCIKIICPKPRALKYGRFTGFDYSYGNSVDYTCNEGYSLMGPTSRECIASGKWQGNDPTCIRLECPVPQAIENGYSTGTSFFHSDTILYKCNDGFEMNGTNRLTCNDAAVWTPELPACLHVQCARLPLLANGVVVIKGLVYGSIAEYSCNDGYDLFGGAQTRRCQADKNWSDTAPKCLKAVCQPPPAIANGGHDFNELSVGSYMTYFCHDGFIMEGNAQRQCLKSLSWTGSEPSCNYITCSEPSKIKNGYIVGNVYLYSSVVTYHCSEGFALQGEAIRRCQANGTWSYSVPICKTVHCDKPSEIISNGRMIDSDFSVGATIRYVCDEGYWSDGSTSRTCGNNGLWDSPIPVCQITHCPRPLKVLNAIVEGYVYDYNSVIRYRCRRGYTLFGHVSRYCLANGTWTGMEPQCLHIQCETIDSFMNGNVTVNKITYKGKAVYVCNEGYVMNGTNTRTCLKDGTWDAAEPVCEPVRCGPPVVTLIEHGQVLSNGTWYGSAIMYSCHEGYSLIGQDIRLCSTTGHWLGSVPICKVVFCPKPSPISRAILIGDENDYGAKLTYECEIGYRITGIAIRTCQSDGTWSGIDPQCTLILCANPTPPEHGNVIGVQYTFNSTIRYTCTVGFEMLGEDERVCLETAAWSGEQPRCIRIECPPPAQIVNGTIIGERFTLGSKVKYVCDEGFRLRGAPFRICSASKRWYGRTPVCIRIRCSKPATLANAISDSDGHQYTDKITYNCNEGFRLVGNSTLKCTASGEWSGNIPNCKAVSCSSIRDQPPVPFAFITRVDGTDYESKLRVTYQCNEGYSLNGNPVRYCTTNGTWAELSFHCGTVACPKLFIQHANLSSTSHDFGSVVEVSCWEGYDLHGSSTLTCLSNSQWDDMLPTCDLIICPTPPQIKNGRYIGRYISYGHEIEFKCKQKFKLVGNSKLQCLDTGQWSSEFPICNLITCPEPEIIENGYFVGHVYEYLENIRYSCNEGFQLWGSATRQCQVNNTWSESAPVCNRIMCEEPRDVPNALTYGSMGFHFEDIRTYRCSAGYTMVGEPERKCLSSGKFSQVKFSCEKVACEEQRNLSNALLYDSTGYHYGDARTYHCAAGYTMVGEPELTCLETGKWSDVRFKCERLACQEPEEISNTLVYNSTGSHYGDVIMYVCAEGYVMVGEPSRRCLATGNWSIARFTCGMISCQEPAEIEHALVYESRSSHYGDIRTYKCAEGYTMVGEPDRMCLASGNWSKAKFLCEKIVCTEPDDIDNSLFYKGQSYHFGDSLDYSCKLGFSMVGESGRRCLSTGNWSDIKFHCQKIDCSPLSIPYANINTSQSDFGTVVSVSCNAGYRLDRDTSLTCTEHGNWSESIPVCELVTCSDPSHTTTAVLSGKDFSYNSKIHFTCPQKHVLEGDSMLHCTDTGNWSADIPQCTLVTCPYIAGLPNARHLPEALAYFYGDVVEFVCDEGYLLLGDPQIMCESNGIWNKLFPYCKQIFCAQPGLLRNGIISGGDLGFEAVLLYECNKGYELFGSPKRMCLLGGEWDFPEPYCDIVHCPDPQQIQNGNFNLQSSSFNGYVEYSCDKGYELIGNYSRHCQEDKSWSGELPVCVIRMCPDLSFLTNASFDVTSFTYETEVNFSCDEMYYLVGVSSVKCLLSGVWSDDIPQCSLITCPLFPELPMVIIMPDSDSYSYKDEVEFMCEKGFYLLGEAKAMCLQNGMWSGRFPFCVKVSCSKPKSFNNGIIIGDYYGFGGILNYSCSDGYVLSGVSHRQCEATGEWDNLAPVCDPVICPKPDAIEDGQHTIMSMEYGGEVVYSCSIGYELLGTEKRLCQPDGTWSGFPPSCVIMFCPDPPDLEFGKISLIGNSYSYGSVLQFVCLHGYILDSHTTEAECLADGSWSLLTFPTCVPIVCPYPDYLLNGKVSYSDTVTVDTTALYVCEEGFELHGDRVRTCSEDGSWTGEDPNCAPISCPEVTVIEHGSVIGSEYSYQSTLSFICDFGYILKGPSIIRCMKTGNWNDTILMCERVRCLFPYIENGDIIQSQDKMYYYEDEIQIICDAGYKWDGPDTLMCSGLGTWDPDVPQCSPVLCEYPPKVKNSLLKGLIKAPIVGDTIAYVCDLGYELVSGDGIMECDEAGKWIGIIPACEALHCDAQPPFIENARAVVFSNKVGGRGRYTCMNGYIPTGDPAIECDAAALWKIDPEMGCEAIDCGNPPITRNSGYELNSAITTFGNRASYKCSDGYILTGDTSLVCGSDGLWDGIRPVCSAVSCDAPVRGDGMWIAGDDYTFGNEIVFSCDRGYELEGYTSVVCQASGKWTSPLPTCQRIPCDRLEAPEFGQIVSDQASHHYGDIVKFECSVGYGMTGQPVITCLDNGLWNDSVPYCVPLRRERLVCDSPPTLPNSIALPSGFLPGDLVSLTCSPGYESIGDVTVTCLQNGTWTKPTGDCTRRYCGRPNITDPTIMLMGRSYFYNDRVVFMCRPGLLPARVPAVLRCDETGHWDGVPDCKAQCKFTCLNGGWCIGFNRCKCPTGFGGIRCQIPICILPCLNRGQCVAPYKCACREGYTGSRCHRATCEPPCQNGGRCVRPNRCHCPAGYMQPDCHDNIYIPVEISLKQEP